MIGDLSTGEVPIVANGQTYRLVLKTKALLEFQKHFSTPTELADLDALLAKAMQGSVEHFTALIWAACLKHHPEMTLAQAIDLIDDAGGLIGIGEQFNALMTSATPDPEDAKELREGANANPRRARRSPRRGTGGSSSSPPAASV